METSPNTPPGASHPDQLTFLSVEAPAKATALPAKGLGLKIQGVSLCSASSTWLQPSNVDLSAGRMFPVSLAATEEMTSSASSKPWLSGGMGSLGGCWTLNISAGQEQSHKGEKGCSLSQVLMAGNVAQRFYLSKKACAGILRRAEKRGKKLPPILAQALANVAHSESQNEPAA